MSGPGGCLDTPQATKLLNNGSKHNMFCDFIQDVAGRKTIAQVLRESLLELQIGKNVQQSCPLPRQKQVQARCLDAQCIRMDTLRIYPQKFNQTV